MPDVVLAPAKLTRSLRITGVRADGYHLIEAEMVALDLADRLTFSPGDGLDISGGVADVPIDDRNLVRRALDAVGRRAHVRLEKHIPAGAGLGGGSADAAAVLRWAGRADDVQLAASLGADVPFCARGGRARVSGIGDEVEPLPFEPLTFTLCIPPLYCSTVEVYRAWDSLGGPTGDGPNDLERAALAVEPALVEWRDRLGEVTGEEPILAGSGATWFVPGEHPGPAFVVARTVPAHTTRAAPPGP